MANPNGIGGFRKGQSGNPGGRTAEEIKAAKVLNDALRSPDLMKVGLEAYKALLEERNPAIVKDFMDRVGGKPADRCELVEPNTYDGKTDEEVIESLGESIRDNPRVVAAFLRGAGLGSSSPPPSDPL